MEPPGQSTEPLRSAHLESSNQNIKHHIYMNRHHIVMECQNLMNMKKFYHSSSISFHIKFTYPCLWPPIATQRRIKVLLQTTKIEREFKTNLDSNNSQCPLLLLSMSTTTTATMMKRRRQDNDDTKETSQSCLSPYTCYGLRALCYGWSAAVPWSCLFLLHVHGLRARRYGLWAS